MTGERKRRKIIYKILRAQLHYLELVYPPISNQESEWLKNDKESLDWFKRSKIYFIGQRAESKFIFEDENLVLTKLSLSGKINFSFKSVENEMSGSIDLVELFKAHDIPLTEFGDLDIELGDKLIRIWKTSGEPEVIDWFTTEKFLYNLSYKPTFFSGFENYRDFTKYHLHYIGISKKNDNFSRLVIKPHDKRLRILSNEYPQNKGSRITDEMILFFFDIDSLEIKQYLQPTDFNELEKNELEDRVRIVKDAEKAFVKILDTNYNEVKFKDYPNYPDTLINSTVERYSFSINEDIEFITDSTTIYGARESYGMSKDQADFIFIDKETGSVELMKIKDGNIES